MPPAPNTTVADRIADAIAFNGEGFGQPGARPTRNNNPGDLKNWPGYKTDAQGYTIFPDEATGRKALVDQINLILSGKSGKYSPRMSVNQMAQVWSPDGSANWARNVSAALGVAPTATISSVGGAKDFWSHFETRPSSAGDKDFWGQFQTRPATKATDPALVKRLRKEYPNFRGSDEDLVATAGRLEEAGKEMLARDPFSGMPRKLTPGSYLRAMLKFAGGQAGDLASVGLNMTIMDDLLGLGGKLTEAAASRSAAKEAMEAAKGTLNPKGGAEKVAAAHNRLAEMARGSLESIGRRAESRAGAMFERAAEAIDSKLPEKAGTAETIAGRIRGAIDESTKAVPELRREAIAALPKPVQEFIAESAPETSTKAATAVDRYVSLARRLRAGGMSEADIDTYLRTQGGVSARDARAVMSELRGGETGNVVSAKRLNELQRLVGKEAFRRNDAVGYVLKSVYKALGDDLQTAAEKAGAGDLWKSANSEWVHYLRTFASGPASEAMQGQTGDETFRAIAGEKGDLLKRQLAHYLAQGDTEVANLGKLLRREASLQGYEQARSFVQRRLPYVLLWPGLQLIRGKPGEAAGEAAGYAVVHQAAEKILRSLALRGLEIPPVIP